MHSSDISDIDLYHGITSFDSFSLLLISAAHMGTALSRLADTEAKKLLFFAKVCGSSRSGFQDMLDINSSVDAILKNMIQLQIILGFKLATILQVARNISCTSVENNLINCLKGRGSGLVTNQCDPFYCGTAIIQACVYDKNQNQADIHDRGQAYISNKNTNSKNNFLYYSVHNKTSILFISLLSDILKMECCDDGDSKTAEIKGIGRITYKELYKPDVIDIGSFAMTAWYSDRGHMVDKLQVMIKARSNPRYNHNSGQIILNSSGLAVDTFSTFRNHSIDSLLSSIASEELKLADTLDAETRKVQSVLMTQRGKAENTPAPCIKGLITANVEAEHKLKDIIRAESKLQSRLENALRAFL